MTRQRRTSSVRNRRVDEGEGGVRREAVGRSRHEVVGPASGPG